MRPAWIRGLGRYGLALLSSGFVLGLTLLVHPAVDLAVLPLFLSAVMVSAWGGGLGPGLLSTVLGSLAVDYFFMAPTGAISLGSHLAHIGEFLLSGLVISGLTTALRREIGRRRRVEEELRAFSAGLEQRLSGTKEELHRALNELDSFSYTLVHDLRAPLRAMGGFSELLLQDYGAKLDSTAHDYAKRVARAADRMDRLIQDLSAYTRLIREEPRVEPVDADPACEEVLRSLADLATRNRAVVSIERPLGAVLGSAGLLKGALTHLVTNAIIFTAPLREPRVLIRAEPRGSYRRIWIEDNGPGIPEPYTDRVFGVFERLRPAGPADGTGMGLAWVRRALERMGGTCGLDTAEGKGTRAWIELKAARDQGSEIPKP